MADTHTNAAVNTERLWQDIMDLAEITEPARPYTRRSFTDLFLKGQEWIRERMIDAGMQVRRDTATNLIARFEGSEPDLPAIVIGSHSDTVPSGGRFDGILGVLAGIEVIRSLNERGLKTRHPVEVVDFLAEEPSEYGLSCVGSRAMVGMLDDELLALTDQNGETISQAMTRIGGAPEDLPSCYRSDIAAYLELHIEQGRVLESGGFNVGLVTGIVGIRRFEIVFNGAADHAGATPFDLRKDALVAAAGTVVAVRRIGEELAARGKGYFIATTGVLDVSPNAANVVPGQARMIVEARAEDTALLQEFMQTLDDVSQSAATSARVVRADFNWLSDSLPALSDTGLLSHLEAAANTLGMKSIAMASGAGHDAAFISKVAPMAMIFVPSRGGLSHCADEWTEPDQCADGAALLLDTLLRVDADPAFDTRRSPEHIS